ncbi:MAG: hypothetical protein ACYC2P_01690 [Paludibacteraceae bacterium]
MKFKYKAAFEKILLILLRLVLLTLILFLIWFFYQEEIVISNFKILNPIYIRILPMKWWEYLIYAIITINIFQIFLYWLFNIWITVFRSNSEKNSRENDKIFAVLLSKYLIKENLTEEENIQLLSEIKSKINSKKRIQSLFSVYVRIQNITYENLSPKFLHLLHELQLFDNILVYLKAVDFSQKILALKVISQLKIDNFSNFIEDLVYSNNYAIRSEAISTLINISSEEKIRTLLLRIHHISLLDVNTIVNSIIRNKHLRMDADVLLMSADPRKKMIGAMIALHNCDIRVLGLIKSQLGHKDEQLNFVFWDAYLNLIKYKNRSLSEIKHCFFYQPEKIKLRILSTPFNTQDPVYLKFLNQILEDEVVLSVKTRAMKLLFEIDASMILNYKDSEDEDVRKAYNEAVCLTINY